MIPNSEGEWMWAMLGLVLGTFGGVALMSLMAVASRADDAMEDEHAGLSENWFKDVRIVPAQGRGIVVESDEDDIDWPGVA